MKLQIEIQKPLESEKEHQYMMRIMGACAYNSDDSQANMVADIHAAYAEARNMNVEGQTWPRSYKCKFIEPGIVNYHPGNPRLGMLYVPPEYLDRIAQSFVGKPVINRIHRDLRPDQFRDEADGVVVRVWKEDGWYWCEFIVWDEATKLNCESDAYSVSCAHDISAMTDGGYHNAVAYDHMALDGEYTHLAIVLDPRYEGSRIALNSQGGIAMFWNFWKGKKENIQKLDPEKTTIDVDGEMVALNSLAATHKTVAENKALNISDDTIVEVDGLELPVADLKNSWRAAKKAKNAADEETKKKEEETAAKNAKDMEEAHEKGDHKDKEAENCAMCKNAKAKNAADLEAQNAKKSADDFQKLKEAAENRKGQEGVMGEAHSAMLTRADRAKIGQERYGKKKTS